MKNNLNKKDQKKFDQIKKDLTDRFENNKIALTYKDKLMTETEITQLILENKLTEEQYMIWYFLRGYHKGLENEQELLQYILKWKF